MIEPFTIYHDDIPYKVTLDDITEDGKHILEVENILNGDLFSMEVRNNIYHVDPLHDKISEIYQGHFMPKEVAVSLSKLGAELEGLVRDNWDIINN